jgi:hypothetical protein
MSLIKAKVGKKTRRKAKPRGFKIDTGALLSFATPKYKDPCYGPLTERSQQEAAEADEKGTLFLLDGKLICECGKLVGAKKSRMSSRFDPDPRPHERYKEPRQPARKRGYGKRI